MSKRKQITVSQLLAFAAHHEGDPWVTRDDKIEFRYRVRIEFIPSSRKKKKRRPGPKEIAKFLAEADRSGSTKQSHYRPITGSASYLLAIRQKMIAAKR